MENGRNEFSELLCKLYMAALLVALPLYTGGNYWNLGTRKYMLFRNVSLLCLGCWLAAELVEWIWAAIRQKGRPTGALGRKRFSAVDWAVAGYGGCVALSALLSGYGELAWLGYDGWHMGAVSQLLFVGIYFFVSRRYDGAPWIVYLGEAATFLVTLFGLLHRLGVDPLGLLVHWNSGDWEYSHMLSTLGNINWLCGYYSVALAFVVVHYLRTQSRWLLPLLYMAAVSTGVLLGVQGSQGGLLIWGVCMAACVLLGRRRIAVLKRVCALVAGFALGMPLMRLLMELRGDKAAIVADGDIFRHVGWPVWIAAAMVSAALALFLAGRERVAASCALAARLPAERTAGVVQRRRNVRIALTVAATVAVTVAFLVLPGRFLDDGFGSGRGFLWRIAAEGFGQADTKGILIGAGPDCFAEAVFGVLGVGSDVWNGEHWDGAVFTNAHNEVLSQLCNVGILGTAGYLAIFLAGWFRFRAGSGSGNRPAGEGPEDFAGWVGLLAIAMYGTHGLISFQQVLNTPLLFLALGICEQECRSRDFGNPRAAIRTRRADDAQRGPGMDAGSEQEK